MVPTLSPRFAAPAAPLSFLRVALCRFLVAAGLGVVLAGPASAQASFPAKPVSVVVPVSAGGAADALARAWASYVAKAIGGTVIVENKPGANGSIAAAFVAKQPADGYSLLFGSTSNMSLNPFSYKTLAYNPVRDFDPVTMIAGTSQVLVTNPASGIKSVQDLVKVAKSKPGVLNYGSAGMGNSTHLNVAFLAQHFGLDMSHVPYKGAAPAMMDLVGGQIDLTADALSGAIPQIKTGKAVPLVVFGSQRVAELPDVPTIYEVGATDFPSDGWYGLMAPKGTPPAVLARLTEATQKFWGDPDARAQMAQIYMLPPAEFGGQAVTQAMQRESATWGPIIKRLGIQND